MKFRNRPVIICQRRLSFKEGNKRAKNYDARTQFNVTRPWSRYGPRVTRGLRDKLIKWSKKKNRRKNGKNTISIFLGIASTGRLDVSGRKKTWRNFSLENTGVATVIYIIMYVLPSFEWTSASPYTHNHRDAITNKHINTAHADEEERNNGDFSTP